MADTLPFDPMAPKALPKPGPRKALTRVQIILICIRQTADGVIRCGCGCGAHLKPKCVDEHLTPRESLPADRCDHIDNRALFNPDCAKAKTVKDQAVIGHWRRVRGDSGQAKRRKARGPVLKSNAKLQSRGFSERKGPSQLSKAYRDKVRERMERG